MGEVPDGQFPISRGKPSTGKTSSFEDNGSIIPTLEVGPQQELYLKGLNSLQRVRPHNSKSMGRPCGSEDFTGSIGPQRL